MLLCRRSFKGATVTPSPVVGGGGQLPKRQDNSYLDHSFISAPQFKALLVRISPTALTQQRAVWITKIITWSWKEKRAINIYYYYHSTVKETSGKIFYKSSAESWPGCLKGGYRYPRDKSVSSGIAYFVFLTQIHWIAIYLLDNTIAIRVNLLHAKPSLFLFGLVVPLCPLYTLVNYYFKVLSKFKTILNVTKGTPNILT